MCLPLVSGPQQGCIAEVSFSVAGQYMLHIVSVSDRHPPLSGTSIFSNKITGYRYVLHENLNFHFAYNEILQEMLIFSLEDRAKFPTQLYEIWLYPTPVMYLCFD